ncbi:dihydrofolate reductase [Lampropedia puyangensis]|uniref:Dihydrofolate reductase n=1 Tax=Lampropedia puyangensis TaxID=1330072 RepID=A0A4S8F6K3_9BURK|nr:dihydrofolate reductase [Lampropedia puyangensis]THU02739.1 dihydrofolate reductase [Lampropedia puyangensis]
MTSSRSPRIALIAALTRNLTIGRSGGMPWHLPQDLRHFKEKTMGSRMIMGSRTWASLPGLLPGREHVVVSSRALELPGQVILVSSLEQALALPSRSEAKDGAETVFVIGGGQVYAQALPFATDLYLTEIHTDIEGDTHFPAWNKSDFVEQSRQSHSAPLEKDGPAVPFDFVHYKRHAT